jgi:short-subunit dehydrogenase
MLNQKHVIFTNFLNLPAFLSIFKLVTKHSEKEELKKVKNKMNFEGKNVLITGASSGIGRAIAEKLIRLNSNLILISRRKELLDEFVNNYKHLPNNIITIKCDVTNSEEVKNSFQTIKDKFEQIDVAILNAGVSKRRDVKTFDSQSAEKIIQTNFLGMVYCIEFLLGDFIQRRDGLLVGISSLADSRGYPRSGFYSASKAAVTKLLESLRIELKPYNVKVIIVKPGFVKSAITDKNDFKMPFLMNADKAAKIIIEGIKKKKTVIEFPLPIVAGSKILKILPNKLYDFLLSLPLPKK